METVDSLLNLETGQANVPQRAVVEIAEADDGARSAGIARDPVDSRAEQSRKSVVAPS